MFKFFRFFRATPKKVSENEEHDSERKSIDLGPVQIDEVSNEWNKRLLEYADRHRQIVPDTGPWRRASEEIPTYLGPVQISKESNEWNKHLIEYVERKRRNVPDIVPEEGNDQPHKD